LILADTDVLIDYLAGIEPIQAQIARYAEASRLQTTAVTCFELLSGAGVGKKGDAIRDLLHALTVLPLDREAATRAAEVRRALGGTGQPIGMGDSLIAGIALLHNVALFTRNRRHFERVPHLKLVDLEEPR
jgi:tRNA(fMet)-specific endonuclease VapC